MVALASAAMECGVTHFIPPKCTALREETLVGGAPRFREAMPKPPANPADFFLGTHWLECWTSSKHGGFTQGTTIS